MRSWKRTSGDDDEDVVAPDRDAVAPIVAAVVLLLLVCSAGSAFGQSGESVTRAIPVDRFRPLPVQRTNLLAVSTSEVLPDLTPAAGLVVHGADDPLEVVEKSAGERRVTSLVDEQLNVEIGLGMGFFDRFDVGVALSVVLQRGEALVDDAGGRASLPAATFADMRLVPRVQIVGRSSGPVGVALAAPIHVPVGDEESYQSAGAVRAEPRAVLDWRPFAETLLALNVGYDIRPGRVALDRASDDVFVGGLGAEFPTGLSTLRGVANVVGEVPAPLDLSAEADGSVEVIGALRMPVADRYAVQVGGGTGLTSALGSPDFRVIVGFEYAPLPRDTDEDTLVDDNDACPQQEEDLDGFLDQDGCPDLDNDGDDVPDVDDECPQEAEDADRYEDADGCPDPDNDEDGIPDAEDVCPVEKGIAEKNGCPFVDSDGDGIDDSVDANPNGAEDKDGYRDDDGAPDPDNDADGIADADDACPLEAEVINGVEDEDGCPDEGDTKVKVTDEKIEIDEKIFFDTDRATIKQRSYSILEQVAAVLKAHPEIEKVRIEGHTDGKGKDLYNLALSQRRANAVRAFLVDRDVDGARLESKGYGEGDPIASNETEEGRSENRRVEIRILTVTEGGGDGQR